MSSKNKAKLLYEEGCNLYLHLFCKKHGFYAKHSETYWAANDIGGVAFIGDYTVSMDVMRYDIDNDIPEDQWFKWYDYTLECTMLGLTSPNYKSWLNGCPTFSREQLDEVKNNLRKNITDARHKHEDFIKNIEPT